MTVSLYSFFMAVLWFSAFILLGTLLQRKTGLVLCYRFIPLLLFLALTLFRLAAPVEVPFTQVIESTKLYPAVQAFLYGPLMTLNGAAISVMSALFGIWLLVAALLCIRLCWQINRDRRAIKGISTIPCQCAEQCLEQLCVRRGITRKVMLAASPEVAAPMLVGIFRPTILLPSACVGLSQTELEYILAHELTHLSSGDLWMKLLIRILCCLLWWNPCVYLLQGDLDRVLEYKCDLNVTKTLGEGERVEYLQTVLDVLKRLEKGRQGQALQVCFCGIPEEAVVKRRFQLVLAQGARRKKLPTLALLTALLIMFTLSYSVVFQPASEPPASDLSNAISITPETSYLLKVSDDTYYLIYENEIWDQLSRQLLQDDPFCYLSIRNGFKEEQNEKKAIGIDFCLYTYDFPDRFSNSYEQLPNTK